MERRPNRPIDYLKSSVNKVVLIRVKGKKMFRATLKGYDEHLNLYLEETSQLFEFQDDEGILREEHENLGNIVIRGDNIIFIDLASWV